MSARAFEPTRLDVETFAAEAAVLAGRWPLRLFDRLIDSAAVESPPGDAGEVSWRVRGEQRGVRGDAPECWLHLGAAATVALVCQRCLAPVRVALDVERRFRFVHGQEAAAELDAVVEDDVLPMARALDLREFIEDELVLALPLVALHETCPEPLPRGTDEAAVAAAPNPFAALAALKRGGAIN